MMQIYLKPSCRKMIIRAARPTESALNEVIVPGVVCNPVSYDLRSNTPEFINAKRYKNFELEGVKRWEHS